MKAETTSANKILTRVFFCSLGLGVGFAVGVFFGSFGSLGCLGPLGPLGPFDPLDRCLFSLLALDLIKVNLGMCFLFVAALLSEAVSDAGIGCKIGVYDEW
jgi:hypothetical protein